MPTKADFAKARAWRRSRQLSVAQLAELTGYSMQSIYHFEIGRGSHDRPIADWAWQRYKMVCAGVELQLKQQTPWEFA